MDWFNVMCWIWNSHEREPQALGYISKIPQIPGKVAYGLHMSEGLKRAFQYPLSRVTKLKE